MSDAPRKPVTRVDVSYQDDGDAQRVGGLAIDADNVVHFQYDAAWIETGRELSPHQLPLNLGVSVVPAPDQKKLHGLHGLFADSLPDDWGWRVMNSALRRHGIDPAHTSVLDRLAYLGTRAMGALSFGPAIDWPEEAKRAASLDALAAEAANIDEGTRSAQPADSATIDKLERAAGTPGGAQPKILYRANGIEYLLKFTPLRAHNRLRTDCGQIEHAFALMAREAGLQTPNTTLFPTTDGRLHFATERFDRTSSGGRRHVHTLGGILGLEASDNGDYDQLCRVARGLTGDIRVIEEALRRLCFNLLVLNDDDHLKNIAFLLDPHEGWQLARAYDITYSPSIAGERGMSIDGKEADVTWADVEKLAVRHGIKPARTRSFRDAAQEVLAKWEEFAQQARVPEDSTAELRSAFEARSRTLSR